MKTLGDSIAPGEVPHADDLFQPRFQRVGERLYGFKATGREVCQ